MQDKIQKKNQLDIKNNLSINLELLNSFVEEPESKLEITEQNKTRLKKMATGQYYLNNLICKGKDKCPYGNMCPFEKEPIDTKCPYEQWLQHNTLNGIIDSLNIDMNNKIELNMQMDMQQIDVMIQRQEAELQASTMLITVVRSDKDGGKSFEKKENPLLTIVERLKKQKYQLIKSFNATRDTKSRTEEKEDVLAKHLQALKLKLEK